MPTLAAPKLVASPARIAANRRNCRRSTGPRTAEGKARSRANAVKHGLTGAGVALATEDAAAIEERFLVIQEELAPDTVLGAELAHELALLSVRRRRCARAEAALLHGRTRHAEAEFDRARAEQADRLVEAIEAQPRGYRRALLATPEGVDRLAEELTMLRAELAGPLPAWSEGHHKRLDALFGFRPRDLPWSRPTRFSRAVLGDFEAIGTAEVEHLAEADERCAWAIMQLIAAIDTEIDRVRAHGRTLDLDALAQDRAAAADAALGDVGRPTELARRYASAAGRDFARTLRDFTLAESLVPAPDEPQAPLEPQPEPQPEAPADPEPTARIDSPPPAEPDPEPVARATPPPVEPTATTHVEGAAAERNPLPAKDLDSSLASFGAIEAPAPRRAAPLPRVAFTPAPSVRPASWGQ